MSALPLCPSCQAPHDPAEAICWMCRRKFWTTPDAPTATTEALPEPEPKRGPYTRMPPPEPPRRPAAEPHVPPPAKAPPKRPPVEAPEVERDGWSQPLLIAAFVLVLTGLAVGERGGPALLWLGLAPAFFVTALAGFVQPKKAPSDFWGKLRYVIAKISSVLAIMILAAVAVIIALAMACTAIVVGLSVMGH